MTTYQSIVWVLSLIFVTIGFFGFGWISGINHIRKSNLKDCPLPGDDGYEKANNNNSDKVKNEITRISYKLGYDKANKEWIEKIESEIARRTVVLYGDDIQMFIISQNLKSRLLPGKETKE